MNEVIQSAGARLFIGGTGALGSEASWTEVGQIESFNGEFGKSFQKITFNPVGDRRTHKRKGAYDQGTLQLVLGRVPSDAGQTSLRAAQDSSSPYNFKITLDDAPTSGTNPAPTTFKFRAAVMKFTTTIGGVNDLVKANIDLDIDSDIEEIPATA